VKLQSLKLGVPCGKSWKRKLLKDGKMGVKNSRQNWGIGEIVKVGFLKLRILGMKSIVDGLPDIYELENLKGDKRYEFTPYNGLVKIE